MGEPLDPGVWSMWETYRGAAHGIGYSAAQRERLMPRPAPPPLPRWWGWYAVHPIRGESRPVWGNESMEWHWTHGGRA